MSLRENIIRFVAVRPIDNGYERDFSRKLPEELLAARGKSHISRRDVPSLTTIVRAVDAADTTRKLSHFRGTVADIPSLSRGRRTDRFATELSFNDKHTHLGLTQVSPQGDLAMAEWHSIDHETSRTGFLKLGRERKTTINLWFTHANIYQVISRRDFPFGRLKVKSVTGGPKT